MLFLFCRENVSVELFPISPGLWGHHLYPLKAIFIIPLSISASARIHHRNLLHI